MKRKNVYIKLNIIFLVIIISVITFGQTQNKEYFLDQNNDIFLLDKYKNEKIVLVFWTTWCQSCKTKLSVINEVVDQKYLEKVPIVGVTFPKLKDISKSEIKDFIQNRNYKFISIFDEKGVLLKKYDIKSVPIVLFIENNRIYRKIDIDIYSFKKEYEKFIKK